MNKKIPIILGIGIIIGIIAWQYYSVPKEKIEIEKEAEEEVMDWQTYRNKKYGFEIDYPYYLEDTEYGTESFEAFFPLESKDVFLEKIFSINIKEEEYDQNTEYYCAQGIPHTSEAIINGINLCKVRSPEKIENNTVIDRYSYFLIHNKKWIVFNLTLSHCISNDCLRPSELDIAKERENFKQIISTLRFLEEEVIEVEE